MASQLKSSLLSSPTTTRGFYLGLNSGTCSPREGPFSLSEPSKQTKPTFQVVQPINGDPFIGSLETPATSLSTHRMVPLQPSGLPHGGIEVGLAHGFLLVGPFVKAGPLCNTPYAGSLAAGGLVVILSICLTMYDITSFKEGEPSTAPSLTLTGQKKEADKLQTADGWAQCSAGFFFGGISGVFWAYFLLYVLNLPYFVR